MQPLPPLLLLPLVKTKTNDDAAVVGDGKVKCSVKKCPHHSVELKNCAFEGCNK
jgi:hypothetical protein